MAAWLAYLKSRLLLPRTETEEELSPEEMAEALRFQLQRLESMRDSGKHLMNLPQIGFDRFKRGMSESISNRAYSVYDLTLFELLKFYGNIHLRGQESSLHIASTRLFSVDEAIERLRRMIKKMPDWQTLIGYLPSGLHSALLARSAVASTFVASLELAKEGHLELRQETSFGPIYIRNRD
jgi:segregation and condensation protein A